MNFIEVKILDQPLMLLPLTLEGCGAVARFEGIVRGFEAGKPISGITYEAYSEMAEQVMRGILQGLHEEHPFVGARVYHRIGYVPVGEAAIILEVYAAHRQEAFFVQEKFMNQLKQDVPIWKVEAR